MRQLMNTLSFLVNIYMIIITIRIVLTWFSGFDYGRFQEILAAITDPYLNWFRRLPLRVGYLDLSPLVALGVLTLVNRIFSTFAIYGTITLGIILALTLQILWGAVSFFLGFLIILLVLRLIAHFAKVDISSPFWSVVDTISRPVLYRVNRFLFRDRIVNFGTGIVISIVGLGISYILLGIIISIVSGTLIRLPL